MKTSLKLSCLAVPKSPNDFRLEIKDDHSPSKKGCGSKLNTPVANDNTDV